MRIFIHKLPEKGVHTEIQEISTEHLLSIEFVTTDGRFHVEFMENDEGLSIRNVATGKMNLLVKPQASNYINIISGR